MITGVNICLYLEQSVRISDMRLQCLRHLTEVLEQLRIYLLIRLGYRIILVDDVVIHIAVICVNYDLD